MKKFAAASVVALSAAAVSITSAPIAHAASTPAPAVVAKAGSTGQSVTNIQTWLTNTNYYHGPISGHFDAATSAALRAFQKAQKLPTTGTADNTTYTILWRVKVATARRAASASPKPPSGVNAQCMTGARVMCVNQTNHTLYYVTNGHVVNSWPVRTGRASLPTRDGVFHVFMKSANYHSHEYGGVAMPYSMFFDRGEAVHYSADFAAHGYGIGSHGCVNMKSMSGVQYLFSQIKIGDKVVVYH